MPIRLGLAGLGVCVFVAACRSAAPAPMVSTQEVTAIRVMETLSHDDYQGRESGTRGAELARDYILSELAKLPCAEVFVQPFRFGEADTLAHNIIAAIPGEAGRAGPQLIISAHYDHLGMDEGEIFNGADDNASGVGAAMTLVERACEAPPQHDQLYIFFDAEEHGLAGARHYVGDSEDFDGRPVFNLNLDMVSQNEGGVIFASGTRGEPRLRAVMDGVERPDGVDLRYGYDDPQDPANDWTNMSDHAPFKAAGLPFLYMGVEDHAHYHKVSDEFETIPLQRYLAFVELIANVESALDTRLPEMAENVATDD